MNKNQFSLQITVIKRVKRIFATLLMLLFSSIIYAQTIALWTFETSQPANSGPYNAEVGAGVATGVHTAAATFSSPVGNGSLHSFRANKWVAGDFFQFVVSTTGYESITFSFSQISSAKGPKTFEVQVSTDGATFTTLAGSNYNVINSTWNATNSNATSVHNFNLPGMGNQPMLVVRLRVVAGSTAVNGSSITASGTSRIDNVSITGSSPLPVTISSFSGAEKDGKNILFWDVQAEQNISHYEVESSKNGSVFFTAGKVIAQNQSGNTSYSFTDEVHEGTTYYRLRIIDKDDGYTISRVLSIDRMKAKLSVSLDVNPVYNILPVTISAENNVSLRIFDIGGKMMFERSYLCNGNTAINLDISGLPHGMYFLKASSAVLLKTIRFVKQ
ncbi:MAG: T9SS type A sorting domain-containing protein [Taibaiella sp.]|jgi:hypothetical protein